ncbi:MAG: lysine-sensitive aspartokinase 3 [Halobacteriovoraceae bacterium]|jgi:aspartate kinase|nr:lysine-sensitive aspartokinase 3 [Halobacteriovoraceae bacterium]MBT5094518.1 lysine-sensitive aspartokinase 3 [Halobacteriovoraceae bacterium]
MQSKNKKIVAKFGGSSMADAECMRRSAEVAIKSNANLILVSATLGTTNKLVALSKSAALGEKASAEQIVTGIIDQHQQLAKDLEVTADCIQQLELCFTELKTLTQGMTLLKECGSKTMDSLYSLGERMSSTLFHQALLQLSGGESVSLLDIREVLKTDNCHLKARPLLDQIKKNCSEKLFPAFEEGTVFVSQGFIGATMEGATTTLGRGGSDYSAALMAEGIDADSLEIWTDVAGIATTDPRLCQKAVTIKEISFQEAAQLATFGAKILHPTTLQPAMRGHIPVFVGSSFDREKGGTKIVAEIEDAPLIRAMAVRSDQAILTITTPKMLEAHGFLASIFKVFDDHQISVDSITTSEISVAITVHNEVLIKKQFIGQLEEMAQVEIEKGLSLVSLIGNRINHTPGLGQKIFNALQEGEQKINVRMICHGASKHNFCFLVKSEEAPIAINRLHSKFIENKESL